MNELSHRTVIDLQAQRSQFAHQTAQRELATPAAIQQPCAPLAGELPQPVPAHLPRKLTLPVSRKRRTHFITVMTPTP
jgi:hypothetical protein